MSFLKAIILDFDGLIVESVEIKDNAFAETFKEYPDKTSAIMAYHFANNAVVRYVKFKHIVEKIIGEQYTDQREKEVIAAFAAYTRSAIIACPFVPGALEFLQAFEGRIPMYLASATPLDELSIIVDGRGLRHFFISLYGAPRKKPEIFREIADREHAAMTEMVFLGDSLGDLAAARESGVNFIGRRNKDDFSGIEYSCYNDMYGIRDHVESLILKGKDCDN